MGSCGGTVAGTHYAHRAPFAFMATMTLPQPTALSRLRDLRASVRAVDGDILMRSASVDVTDALNATPTNWMSISAISRKSHARRPLAG